MIAELLGWIGAVCLAARAIPQAIDCWRRGNADGLHPMFLALWLAGEVCLLVAVLWSLGCVSWLVANYLANLGALAVIIYYKLASG